VSRVGANQLTHISNRNKRNTRDGHEHATPCRQRLPAFAAGRVIGHYVLVVERGCRDARACSTSASELAARVIERLPQRSLRQDVRMVSIDVRHEVDCGRCPCCGRSLPDGSIQPVYRSVAAGGVAGIPTEDCERIAACLVDGPRGCHARPFALAELVVAAHDVYVGLGRRGWKHWTERFADVFEACDQWSRAEEIGQALEVLGRFGPLALEPAPELQVLIASFARHWPTKRRRATDRRDL
jgi:hypothetical protein